jgi:hypothetical protein
MVFPDERVAVVVLTHGTTLFQRVCEMDLEGIVAKHSYGHTSPSPSELRGSRSRIVATPDAGPRGIIQPRTSQRACSFLLAVLQKCM